MAAPIEIERVLVRSLSPRFSACIREDGSVPIDLGRAQQQHRAYVTELGAAVDEVIEVPDSAAHPDGVFVEDTAVMIDAATALITRSGASSRRREVDAVAETLTGLGFRLIHLQAPATLDGGDVLRIGQHLMVGRSPRTNAAGIEALAVAARPCGLEVVPVPVRWGLHLKTGCSLADEETLLYYQGAALDIAPFASRGLSCVPVDEPCGANVLALGRRQVLVSAASPTTANQLADRGLDVRVLDVSELHKADAALTCPSVRIPPAGGWCT